MDKRVIIGLFLMSFLTVSFLTLNNTALAAAKDTVPTTAASASAGTALSNPLGDGVNFTTIANRVIKYALGLVGVFALIAFIWGGIEWMISGGDTKKIQKGKDMMIWAVFGLVFIFGSYALINIVLKALAGPTT